MTCPLFVVVEGLDGSGKSSVAELLGGPRRAAAADPDAPTLVRFFREVGADAEATAGR